MLNRRTLRIKAMQAIYAFKHGQSSDMQLSKDLIKKEADLCSENMNKDIENIYDEYLLVLLLLISLSDFVEIEEKEKKERLVKSEPTPEKKLKFFTNQVIKKLRINKALQKESVKLVLSDSEGTPKLYPTDHLVRDLYKKVLKKDKKYLEYLELNESSFEEDMQIIKHLLKRVILKAAVTTSYFEDRDMSWPENKYIVESLLNTVRSVTNESNGSFPLAVLSQNWKEDKIFFENLYKKTIDNDDEYDKLVAKKVKNWAIERIAAIDRILLKMAISEMINFQDIPVNVTINEYIEIAKLYSTPKSKEFINGILDNIAKTLAKKGMIKKSGKGIIDNK